MMNEEDRLELQKAALEYIDQTGTFSTIQKKCRLYQCQQQQQQERAFYFKVPIEPADLLDLDAILGNLVLNRPTAASKVFQEVVHTMISCLSLLPQCQSLSQVIISLQLQSLPLLPCYQLQSTRDLIGHGQDRRLLQYTGVIIGLSMAHTYTKSARFVCNIEGCRGSTGNHFIRLHIAGAREKQTIRTDFTCTFCGSRLEEDISFRVLGDKINLELVDTETFSRKRGKGHRYQSLVTYVRDDLVCPLEPGETVSVIGLPVFDIDNQTVALEANNIFRHNQQLPVTPVVNLNDLPESIQHLYKDRSHSPWRFSLSLAYAFAGDVTPAGTYLHLKLGMLLSLVGYSVQEAGGLDLLAVGWDTLLLQRLLSYAASLADRSIVHSPGTGHLTASVSRDRHGSDACFIEGGSLLLARGGVCLIPELNSVKKATKQLLAHVLESDKVPVELPQRFTRHGAQRFTLPRRSHVWSYTDHISCHAPHLDDLTAPQVVVGKDGIAKTLAEY